MIYKRGKKYWYKFMFDGQNIRESTRQGNDKVARQMEAAHRTSLAKGEVGIRDKNTIPTLGEFFSKRLKPWARSTFEKTTPNSWFWFRTGIAAISKDKELSSLPLMAVNNEALAKFAAKKLQHGYAISYINGNLRIIRRALNLAVEWMVIDSAPKIKILPGERNREHVVTTEEERQYLAVAEKHDTEMAHVFICLVDTGLRPEEFYRMTWDNVNWHNGAQGCIFIAHGKTPAAWRAIPMSARLRFILEHRWEQSDCPRQGWVWPSGTKTGHFEQSTIKKRHQNILKLCLSAGDQTTKVRRFVMYSLRHTFLTRLGGSGCDAWTLANIAGHSQIAMSHRYVHPSGSAVANAMDRLAGHRIWHSERLQSALVASEVGRNEVNKGDVWCTRQDSNLRPNASEAFALSS